MSDDARSDIIRRLRVVGESLLYLQALVEAGAPCGQILCQLSTVQTELQATKVQLLKCQIDTSKSIIQFNLSADNRMTELHHLFDLYNMLIQST